MDKIIDQYRLYVTSNPLYLDSLEQPAVQDYFLEHPYNISKVLPSPRSMVCMLLLINYTNYYYIL